MHAFEKYPIGKNEKLREKCGVLFRAEADGRCNRVIVYVQSTVKPDWSFLVTSDDYLLSESESPNPTFKDISPSYQHLQDGQFFSFRFRANPSKRIAKPTTGANELKGKRVGLLREEEQIEWLVCKASDSGFELLTKKSGARNGEANLIPQVHILREGKRKGYKRIEGCPHEMTHLSVLFDGLLRITDASIFRESLVRGIGPAKAFGCGLLSIARC